MDKESLKKELQEKLASQIDTQRGGGADRSRHFRASVIHQQPASPRKVVTRGEFSSLRPSRGFRKPSQLALLPTSGGFSLIANKRGFPQLDFVISCGSCGADAWTPCIGGGVCKSRKFDWIARANASEKHRECYKKLSTASRRWVRETKPEYVPPWERADWMKGVGA